MTIPDALTLKKAMKIAIKIEKLQQKLHELLGAKLELPPATVTMTSQLVELSNAPRRRGRPRAAAARLARRVKAALRSPASRVPVPPPAPWPLPS